MADKLIDYFEGEGAVNYIEQTFECNHDSSKSIVLTMQKIEGLTPCQKLAKAEKLNADMCEEIKRDIECLTRWIDNHGDAFPMTAAWKDMRASKIELLKRVRG